MATSTRVLSQSQIRLLQEGSIENDKLATFWNRKSTALVLIDWLLPGRNRYKWNYDHVKIEVQANHGSKEFDMREFHIFPIELGKKELEKFMPWERATRILVCDAKKEFADLFESLASQYNALMIATHEANNLLERFKGVGFQLPRGVAVVDLIKVLNYHSLLGLDALDTLEWMCSSPIVKVDGEWMRKYGADRGYGEETYSKWLLQTLGPVAKERIREGDKIVRSQKNEERLRNQSEADKRRALKGKIRAQVARGAQRGEGT